MFAELEEQEDRANEPELLRKMTKNAIYKLLAVNFILPKSDSRAISRRYLVGLYTEMFFKVRRSTLLEFESRLRLEEQVKSSNLSVPTVIDRTNRLLALSGEVQLGFEGGGLPDEDWLYRLVRFVDPYNLTGTFRLRVAGTPRPPLFEGRV